MAERDAERCASAPDFLGARALADGVAFAVASRHAERISVCLFDAHDHETDRLRLIQREGDVHYGFVPGLVPGQRYGLRVDGPWNPRAGHRFDPAKLLVDPYATRLDRAFVYDPALTLPRDVARDTAALVPKAVVEPGMDCFVAPLLAMTERIAPRLVYEVAVKAHTKLDDAVPLDLRGTLAGIACPHVIERFIKLGVSHVELMPIAAWIDERHLPPLGLTNAWGYNPVTMMALDPRLAPDGHDDLRRVVDALHAAGIGVLLDIVFNHTGESDAHGPTLSLRGLDNATYYRHTARGGFVNDTGCGNVLACDEPIVQRLVLDTLRLFATRTGVDGFRFDLATTLGRDANGFRADAPLLRAIAADPDLRDLLLIAEPWDVGPGGYQVGAFGAPWREWNDRYRDDVRRFWRGDHGAVGAFATRVAGSSDFFAREERKPSASVNFLAAHDGFTLRDLVSFAHKRNHANGEHNRDGNGGEVAWECGVEGETHDAAIVARRAADVRALLATLFVSRGLPMLTAGDEFGRTQNGNNNAYAQDNALTWLDWRDADCALARFVGALAELRAAHSALNDDAFLTGAVPPGAARADAIWTKADGARFADHDWRDADFVMLTLAPAGAARVHLVFNRAHAPVEFAPPAPTAGCAWRLALDSARGFVGAEAIDARPLVTPARAVLALVETPDLAREP